MARLGKMRARVKKMLRIYAERTQFVRSGQPARYPIAQPSGNLFVDYMEVDPCGLIRVFGWSQTRVEPSHLPQLFLEEEMPVPALQEYRYPRPDVHLADGPDSVIEAGVACEYLVPQSATSRTYSFITLRFGIDREQRIEDVFRFVDPHYRVLFDSPEVFHREHIYCSGPPNAIVNEETRALAFRLKGPVLDFGCGSGALISEFLQDGIAAHGLELDTPVMRTAVHPEILPYVTFYDGQFPIMFETGSFRSVFCSEVLEHIPDFRGAIREIARVTSENAIFTVPNASAIPIGFRHQAVPWHLMEGTHVNFFNQRSLERELKPHFRRIEFGRLGQFWLNDSLCSMSLFAMCWK